MVADRDRAGEADAGMRWQMLLSAGGLATVVIGALVSFYVQESNLTSRIVDQAGRIAALEAQFNVLSDHQAQDRAQIVAFDRSLVAIQAQFCSQDQRSAIFHAYDLRIESMLFVRVFGQEIPISNAVYPSVAGCGALNHLNTPAP